MRENHINKSGSHAFTEIPTSHTHFPTSQPTWHVHPTTRTQHPLNPYTLSPPVFFVNGALRSIFLVINHYQIMFKYCSSIKCLVNKIANISISNSGLDPSIIVRILIRKCNKDVICDVEFKIFVVFGQIQQGGEDESTAQLQPHVSHQHVAT